ncbi:MAG: VCBS repeat-containing protein [Candidatus Thermoplasmatota archaeon]|nr:VCBS repeat-containing protein [Candidatus Thermoplasmatota archaeon]
MLQRRPLDHRGVSEVIGTILILLITVIIFSTIVLWVFTLPTPRAASNVGIDGTLEGRYVAGSWSGAYVNLTHLGGDDLLDTNTRIYLTIDNQTHTFRTRGTDFDGNSTKPYGVNGPDVHWNIGETWSYVNYNINETARISVLVVDVVRGTVVWDQVLLGEGGERMPVFLEKWVDSEPSSPSRDPVGVDDTFAVYTRVGDPDGDLNPASVRAYLTFGYGVVPIGNVTLVDNGPSGGAGDKIAGDGIFSRALIFPALRSWDGGIIILNAMDMGGREAQTRLVLKVLDTGITSQVQGPGTLGFGSDVQRYDIFEIGDWDANGWEATSTRSFVKEQGVVVVVASKRIPNPDLKNTFLLWDWNSSREVVYSNTPYTDPVTGSSVPSTTQAFELTEFISGFYIYEYRFNTASAVPPFDGVQLQLGYYPLEFELITSQTPSPENRLYVTDYIRVTDISGGSPDYPRVETYRDPGHAISATSFNFSDIMYVKVIVGSTDGFFDIGNIIISDFIGNLPVWASPGNTPVSLAAINDTTSYAFSVDLSQPNLDPWNFGTVSYNLAIMNVQDVNEDYGRVWGQIKVTGPRWKLDIAMGLMSTSQQNFDLTIYGDFFDNVEGWTEYTYETFLASPGNRAPVNPITSQVLGDLDGDGDLDVLAGTEMGHVWWYRNRDGKAHSMFRTVIDTLTSTVTGAAVGHVDGDPDLDAAVGTATGDIWWYRNDGSWSPNFVDNAGASVTALQLADVNGDGAADLIVGLDVVSDSVRVYLNNGEGVFGEVRFEDTLMASDFFSLGHGTVDGNFLLTAASDDLRQEVEEVASDGFVAASEAPTLVETVQGSFLDTYAPDGVVQILTEGETGALPQYTLGFPGHGYLFLNMTAAASDTLELHLVGHISSGSESFAVGWSKDGFSVTWVSGLVDGLTRGEYIWSISGVDWTDETLFVHFMDVDDSRRDQETDGQLTSLSVDQLYVLQPGSGSLSSLAKVWKSATIPSGKDAYKFFVEAHHTFNAENDHLLLQVAAAPHGPYYGLVVVTKTVDDDGTQSVSLPADVGGRSLYILAQDTDRSFGATVLDTFSLDHLFFRSYDVIPAFWPIDVGDPVRGLTVADIDGDGLQDIVVATTGIEVHVYYGDGTGMGWPDKDILPHATSNLLTIDVGFVSADLAYDIVVGTDDTNILLYTNGGSRGSWSLTTITSLGSDKKTSTLRVGDVDGDNWDDVVVGTEGGSVIYLRNDQGTGWRTTTIIQMTDRIDVIDIGDADRGVIIRPHPY